MCKYVVVMVLNITSCECMLYVLEAGVSGILLSLHGTREFGLVWAVFNQLFQVSSGRCDVLKILRLVLVILVVVISSCVFAVGVSKERPGIK